MDISWKTLLCFKKVAELEHMTNAAKELYISQAQLSRTIAELEDDYGVKFFDRVGKGIKLNACGRVYYDYVQHVITIMGNARKAVEQVDLHRQNQLTVVSNVGSYMPELFSLLAKKYPEVKIRQISATRKRAIQSLKEGIADFAICCPIIDDIDIKSDYLLKENGVIIFPEGHWLKDRPKVSVAELADESLVGAAVGYGVREATDAACRSFGITPNYAVETSDTALIPEYVDRGFGISIVHKTKFIRDAKYKNRISEPIEPVFGMVGLSWMKDRAFSDSDAIFYQTAMDFYRDLRRLEDL